MINNMYKVKVENLKQLDTVLSSKKVSEIILSRDSFAESDLPKLVDKIKKTGKFSWILLERISRYEEQMKLAGANANFVGEKQSTGLFSTCGARRRVEQDRRGELCEPIDLRTSTDKIFEIKNLDGIIIQNLDSFAYMLRKINKATNEKLMVELNYNMNCYNSETKSLYKKMYNEKRNNASEVPLRFTTPLELNTYELSDVSYDTMILYSYIDTMVTANCLRKNILAVNSKSVGAKHVTRTVLGDDVGAKLCEPTSVGAKHREPTCKYRFNFNKVQDFSSYIIDRKGKKLFYKTYCKYCYNKIFNTEPLFLLDKIEEIKQLKILRQDEYVDHKVYGDGVGVKTCGARRRGEHHEPIFRIDFSFENEKQVKDILAMKSPESFTRGHYKSSIK